MNRTQAYRAIIAGASLLCLSTPALAQEEKLVPASPTDFDNLLMGCWHAMSFGDGPDFSFTEDEALCFGGNGKLTFSDSNDSPGVNVKRSGRGTYYFRNDRLFLNPVSGLKAWQFDQQQINCNASVRPGKELAITDCIDDQAREVEKERTYEKVQASELF